MSGGGMGTTKNLGTVSLSIGHDFNLSSPN